MSIFHRFIINISWNMLGKVCVLITSFALSVLITRYLGKNLLGVYATVLTIPAIIRLMCSFGLETVVNKRLPELNVKNPSQEQARFLLRGVTVIRILSTLLFCLVLYFTLPFYLDWISMGEILAYRQPILLYFVVISINSLLTTLFMTLLRYKVTSFMEGANSILNLALLISFIFFDWGISGILYAYIASTGITIGIYSYLAKPYLAGKTQKPEKSDTVHLAWVSYVIGLFSFGLMIQSDIVLMNYFGVDTVRVGYYHLATGIGGMLIFMLVGIGPMALSIFSETFKSASFTGLSKAWQQILGFTIFCTVPIYVFSFFNAELLITFIYGDQFAGTGKALSLYLIFVLINTVLGAGFAVSTLYVIDRKDIALRSTVEGSILNIALNLILIPLYQEVGAILATGSALVYMSVRQLYYIQKYIDARPVLPFAGKCFLLSLLALAPSVVLAKVWTDHLILNFVTYAIAFPLILVWIKPLTKDQAEFITGHFPQLGRWLKWFVKTSA